jgi:hypothetical protein
VSVDPNRTSASATEPAPTIDLQRSRSLGEILRSTLKLYGDYPWLFLILAAAVMVPWDLIKLVITGHGPLGRVHNEGFLEEQSLSLVALLLVSPLISAMHVHAVVVIGDRRRPRLSTVAWAGVRVLPMVGVAAGIAGVAISIGFLLLVIPGIVLWIGLAVVAQAAAVERRGVRAAWRRSWELSRDHGSHIFAVLIAIALPFAIVEVGIRRGLDSGTGSSPGALALGMAIDTLVASVTALVGALLYFDLVNRQREAYAAPVAATS